MISECTSHDGHRWRKTPAYLFIPGYEVYYTGRDSKGKNYFLPLHSTKFNKLVELRKQGKRA